MSKLKLIPLIFILSLTILAVSCSEEDQDVIPTQIDVDFDYRNMESSPDPIRESDRKKTDPSIQLKFDSTKYSHHFKDIYGDYFYFNEVSSYLTGTKLYKGVWEIGNTVYAATMIYEISSKSCSMAAHYRQGMIFYYHLHLTADPKYAVGAFTYLNPGAFTLKARNMNLKWIKGRF